MRRWRLGLLAVFWLALMSSAVGAEISLTLELDRQEATPQDSVGMVVRVSGARQTDSMPVLKGFEDFSVTLDEDLAREAETPEGAEAEVRFTYRLHPKRLGTFRLGPAEMTVQGQNYESNTAALRVVTQTGPGREEQVFVSLKAELSAQQAYAGEPLVYTLRLHQRARVGEIDLTLPKDESLFFEQLGNQAEYKTTEGTQEVQVLEVKYVLIPSRAGHLKIPPARMTMKIYPPGQADRGTFDTPLYALTSGMDSVAESEPLPLDVLPLPEEGRPADFTGLVGTFQLVSRLEPAEIKTGESAALTLSLSGQGNVNQLPDLDLPPMDRVKTYLDQASLDREAGETGLTAKKTARWVLVPAEAGTYSIPALSLSFFDPRKAQYQRADTLVGSLSVLPGEAGQGAGGEDEQGAAGLSLKHGVRELGRDILPVRGTAEDLTPGFRVRAASPRFWAVLLIPLLVFFGNYWVLRSLRRTDRALALSRARKAARNLARACRQAGCSSSDLAGIIREYLNDRFTLSLAAPTPEEAREILRARGVTAESAGKLHDLMKGLENEIYTGQGQATPEAAEGLQELIKRIERELK